MSDWIDSLEKLAPTIATALGSPVAGMAVSALESALGITGEEDVQKTIEAGKLNGDQVAAIQQAELAIKAKAQELGLDFTKLQYDDKKSARDMQSATHSVLPPLLSILVTAGFFGILYGLMTGNIKQNPEIDIMLGSLGTAWTGIITFYFGSSAGSQNKDQLLYNSTPTK